MSSNYITIKTEDGKIIKISMIPLKVVGIAKINLRLRGTINLYVDDKQYKMSGTHCLYRYKYDELEDRYNTIIDITTNYGRPFIYFNAEVSADGSIINPNYAIEYIEDDTLYIICPMEKKPEEEDTDEYYFLGSEIIEYHLEDRYIDYPSKQALIEEVRTMNTVMPLDLPFITPDKGLIICSTSKDFDKCMGDKSLSFLLGNTDDYQPHYSSYDEWKNK